MQLLRSNRTFRLATVPAALALALSLAACSAGDDDPGALDEGDTETAAATDDTISLAEDDSLEGLEVTVTGNVSEVVDEHGFRVDKDGLGGEDGSDIGDLSDAEDDIPFVEDANFYDYDYYTSYDEEFGEDGEDEGVLVFDSTGSVVAEEQPVQVTGAIRRFDESTLEDFFDLDLDDAYDDLDQVYAIIADSVTTSPSDGATATPSPTDGTSPVVSEVPTEASEDPEATEG